MAPAEDETSPAPGGGGRQGDRIGLWLNWTLGLIAASCMLLIMVFTFVAVLSRYAFNAPVPGDYELTKLMMGVLVFGALPVVCWRRTHITIDLLDPVTPRWCRPFQEVLTALVVVAVLCLMSWQLWLQAALLASYPEVTEFLRIPIHPFVQALSVLSAVSALIVLAAMVRAICHPDEAPPGQAGN